MKRPWMTGLTVAAFVLGSLIVAAPSEAQRGGGGRGGGGGGGGIGRGGGFGRSGPSGGLGRGGGMRSPGRMGGLNAPGGTRGGRGLDVPFGNRGGGRGGRRGGLDAGRFRDVGGRGAGRVGGRDSRVFFVPSWFWGPGFFGAGMFGPGFGWGSPFYDPFYGPAYDPRLDEARRRDDERRGIPVENIEVDVSPKETSVYVNDLLYSQKGRARFSLPQGNWRIELRAPGYVSQAIDLNVEPGVRYTIERKLERDPASPPERRPRREKGPAVEPGNRDGEAEPASGTAPAAAVERTE